MPAVNRGASHLQQVDYVRAVASLGVALFHLGGKALPLLKYGWLGVEMFFVLSGFIICHSLPENYFVKHCGQFIIKRLVRIEPPYVVSIILIIALNFAFLKNYQPNWTNVLMHLAYMNNYFGQDYLSPVYWTLGIEFQFYLFIAFVFPLFKQKWGIGLLTLLCLISYLPVPHVPLTGVFPLFAMGMLYHFYRKGRLSAVVFVICLIVPVVMVYLKLGLLPLAAGLFALALLMLPLKANKVVGFLSVISFSLYLTHDRVGASLVVYVGTLLPKTILFKGVAFLTGIIISIMFAWLFYRLIETPFLKLSKKIGYKSKDRSVATPGI